MIVNGKMAYTIGDICMDMCMLDVTNITCQVGDRAIVFGDSSYTLDDIANDLETIPYEILTEFHNALSVFTIKISKTKAFEQSIKYSEKVTPAWVSKVSSLRYERSIMAKNT